MLNGCGGHQEEGRIATLSNDREDRDAIKNPFTDNSVLKQVHLRRVVVSRGPVNGYLKMRVVSSVPSDAEHPAKRQAVTLSNGRAGVHHKHIVGNEQAQEKVYQVPPDFGRGYKLDRIDQSLLAFCKFPSDEIRAENVPAGEPKAIGLRSQDLRAFCRGRTLLPRSNAWLDAFGSMLPDDGVRHSMLAFASTYVLDYQSSTLMLERANFHYERAVDLLGKKLANARDADEKQIQVMVGSIILLNAHDVSAINEIMVCETEKSS